MLVRKATLVRKMDARLERGEPRAPGCVATSAFDFKKLKTVLTMIAKARRPAPQPPMSVSVFQGMSAGGLTGCRVKVDDGSVGASGSSGPNGSEPRSSGAGSETGLGT